MSYTIEKISSHPQAGGRLDVVLSSSEAIDLPPTAFGHVRVVDDEGREIKFYASGANFIRGQNLWRWQQTGFEFVTGKQYEAVVVGLDDDQ